MEYRTNIGNRMITDTPDELYEKFIGIVAGLPEDAVKWTLPLCNTYFSALTIPLQDKMEDDDSRMPLLYGITTNTLQVGALRLVRSAAVALYWSLNN